MSTLALRAGSRHHTSTRWFSLPRQGTVFSRHILGARKYSISARNNAPGSADELVSVRSQSKSNLEIVKLSPIVLRDSCKCPQCIDPSDRQRNYSYAEIPTNIQVKSQSTVRVDGQNSIAMEWENDIPGQANHQSIFSTADLSQLLIPHRNRNWVFYRRPRKLWNKTTYRTDGSKRIGYNGYMNNPLDVAKALHLLWRDGLVFIDQVPESEESVRKIVERIGPLQNTFYGPTWDVRSVPQPKNVAYTSKYLGFHMDLLYMRDPPGLQFLHCIHNSCTGGESRFADTFHAVDELYSQDGGAEMVEALKLHKIRYEYDNDGFFYSDLKPTIVDASKTPFGRTINAKNPVFMGSIEHVFWSPPFVGNIDAARSHQGLTQFIKASKAFSDILESPENVMEEKMESGTCVIFDNQRIVHARNEFDANSGKRWLKGAYLAHQDFISKAVSLQDQMQTSDQALAPIRRIPLDR